MTSSMLMRNHIHKILSSKTVGPIFGCGSFGFSKKFGRGDRRPLTNQTNCCRVLSENTVCCFAGLTCDLEDYCASQPCRNNGKCFPESTPRGYRCECLSGFVDPICNTDVNECITPGLCQNGGTCVNLFGAYR